MAEAKADAKKGRQADDPASQAIYVSEDKYTKEAIQNGVDKYKKFYHESIWKIIFVIAVVVSASWLVEQLLYKSTHLASFIVTVMAWVTTHNMGSLVVKAFEYAIPADIVVFSIGWRLFERWWGNKDLPEYDFTVRRWRFTRMAHSVFIALLCFALPISLLEVSFGWIHPYIREVVWIVGFDLGLVMLGFLLPWITVSVPEVQGLVSLNMLAGMFGSPYVIYGPGLHFRFIWESIHRTNHIFLRDVTTKVPGNTWPSRDMTLIGTFIFRWKPVLHQLASFFQLGESTVNNQFVGLFQTFFSTEIKQLKGELAILGQKILGWEARSVFDINYEALDRTNQPHLDKLYKMMSKALDLEGRRAANKSQRQAAERKYGINMLNVELIDLDRSAEAQEARDAIAVSEALSIGVMKMMQLNPNRANDRKRLKQLLDEPKSRDDLLRFYNRIVGMSKDANVNVTIFEGIQGGEGLLKAAAATIAGKK